MRGICLGGSYKKGSSTLGSILGFPYLGKLPCGDYLNVPIRTAGLKLLSNPEPIYPKPGGARRLKEPLGFGFGG